MPIISQRPPKPISSFLVLPRTMGRCGSTWFCDLIAAHPQVACVGEVFNPRASRSLLTIRGTYEQDLDAERLFGRIKQQDRLATQVGLKTFREQLGDKALEPLLQATDKLLLLERRNLTAALVSELRAQQTSLWHATNKRAVAKDLAAEPLTVDIEAGRQRLRHALENGLQIDAMADAAGPKTLRLTYEDLVEATDVTMRRVFEHLGVEPRPVRSNFKKVHTSWDFIRNLEDVNRELGPEFGQLDG